MVVHASNSSTLKVEEEEYQNFKVIFTYIASSKPTSYMKYCLKKLKPKYDSKNNSNKGDLFSRCLFPTIERVSS